MLSVILCCYYLTPYEMVQCARRAFKSWGDIDFRIYSTNERHVGASVEGLPCHFVDNALNDFSAYRAACGDAVRADAEGVRPAAYIFLNDTLFLKHPASTVLKLLRNTLSTIAETDAPVLAGKADPYGGLLQTSPFALGLDRYVASFVFGTNYSGVCLLADLLHEEKTQKMVESVLSSRDDDIPKKFSSFLKLHLRSGRSEFAWKNPGLDRETVRRKAACVLLEHYISARFFVDGFICPLNSTTARNVRLLAAYQARRIILYRRTARVSQHGGNGKKAS